MKLFTNAIVSNENDVYKLNDVITVEYGDIVRGGYSNEVLDIVYTEKVTGKILKIDSTSLQIDCSKQYENKVITIDLEFIKNIERIKAIRT